MTLRAACLLSLPAALLLAASVLPYRTGTFPGTPGRLGTVPADAARKRPSCGRCHGAANQGANRLRVSLVPSAFSLAPSQSISLTTSATGGVAGTLGGFLTEVSAGRLSAGKGSQVTPAGTHATHVLPGPRRWRYGFTAPKTPGLVEVLTVVNTVNGNFLPTGDAWGFHGASSAAAFNTPVRLFVNPAGVTEIERACAGTGGNLPILGAASAPTVGNGSFALELHGAVPSTRGVLAIGANPAFRVDLTPFGVTGCVLRVQLAVDLPFTTSAGNARRGDGSARVALPIPNDPGLRNAAFEAQAVIVDPASGRPLPLTLSNALRIAIR